MIKNKEMVHFFVWTLILFSVVVLGDVTNDPPCHFSISMELKAPQFLANGSVKGKDKSISYPKGTFWINETSGVYYGCPCLVVPCLRLCNSVDNASPFQLTVWKDEEEIEVNSHEHFVPFHELTCPSGAVELDPEEYKVLHNGSLFYVETDEVHGVDHFCMAHNISGDGTTQAIVCFADYTYLGNNSFIMTTGPNNNSVFFIEKPRPRVKDYLYPVWQFVSTAFLALTLLAYTVSPQRHNLHGRIQIAYCSCLMVGFAALFLIQITGFMQVHVNICYVFAFTAYVFIFAAFFWSSVMCFDIWWAFSGLARSTSSLRQKNTRKFLLYCAYACGSPIALFIITCAMDESSVPKKYKPGFGDNGCWFQNTKVVTAIYFYGPIATILTVNLVFFTWTTVNLMRHKKQVKAAFKKDDSKIHCKEETQNKQRFLLYVRLFLVMGLGWIMEVISWGFDGKPEGLWYVSDTLNLLQGIFIFLVSVWGTPNLRNPLLKTICPNHVSSRLVSTPSVSSTTGGGTKSSRRAPDSVGMASLSGDTSRYTESEAEGESMQEMQEMTGV